MSTCEWCGLEIHEKEYYSKYTGTEDWYHYDCWTYGKCLDTEAIGWLPTVVPTEKVDTLDVQIDVTSPGKTIYCQKCGWGNVANELGGIKCDRCGYE